MSSYPFSWDEPWLGAVLGGDRPLHGPQLQLSIVCFTASIYVDLSLYYIALVTPGVNGPVLDCWTRGNGSDTMF